MFNKPVKVKSNNQVKATERKNIKAKIQSCYPDVSENDLNLLMPSKAINVLKVMTHSGIDVIVYALEKRAVFFECENILYPSVYTLWKLPDLLPSFTTHRPVLPKLMQGADLMIPGVVLPDNIEGPAAWGKFEKGHLVSINLTNNKAPIAIAKTCHSSMDMYMAGGRGRCAEILHIVGDELCSLLSPTLSIPEMGPPTTKSQNTEIQEVIEDVKNIILDVPEKTDDLGESVVNTNSNVESGQQDDVKELSISDIDALLQYSFLKCLKNEGKKLVLPMLTSTFYGTHILAACPEGSSLDIKKSSYKKVSKFLLAMSKEGFLKLGEQKKGVEVVTELNIEHPLCRSFQLDEHDKPKQTTDTQGQSVSVENMLRVTKPVLPILLPYGFGLGQIISRADVRKSLRNFVKDNSLQNIFVQRVVILNPLLKDICGTSAESLEWSRLFEKIENRMTAVFEMKSGFQTIQCKGKPPVIVITVSSRANKKKVTLVDNLVLFGIDLQEFSKHCQHGVATSTSIKSEQVLIQGNQVAFVGKLLKEQYKIPKKYIRGLELAVKKK